MSCDIAIVYFRTAISVVVNHLEKVAAVASKVVASLVSRYEKAHFCEK